MDPTQNPFSPGAGTPPPALVGRSDIMTAATIALGRVKAGRHGRSQMLLGLRGVGKTVLLNGIAELAAIQDFHAISLEAPENRSLAEMLVPKLRSLLLKLSRVEKTKDVAKRGLGVLRAFASAFKVTVADIELGVAAESGVADSGNLENDLPELLLAVAEAAKVGESAVALFVDEVQYLSEEDLGALIVSLHQLGQKGLPFIMFGAGLPQLAGLAGDAKSYAERLFDYPGVGPLPDQAAREAIKTPVVNEKADISDEALALIASKTQGYPYFIQEWGAHTWNEAQRSPIVAADVERATVKALQHLDNGFFRVRMDRLTPREKDYVRAMAELGPGPHRSGEIAVTLKSDVNTVAPLRDRLIKKGMIYSPQHGDNAFTVPMFDEFMRRSMPNWTPDSPVTPSRGRKKKK
ncbi:AAA family ATPase [Corallococcus caeni]